MSDTKPTFPAIRSALDTLSQPDCDLSKNRCPFDPEAEIGGRECAVDCRPCRERADKLAAALREVEAVEKLVGQMGCVSLCEDAGSFCPEHDTCRMRPWRELRQAAERACHAMPHGKWQLDWLKEAAESCDELTAALSALTAETKEKPDGR